MVRWPADVKAGSVSRPLVHQADVLATVAEVLGAKLPDTTGEDGIEGQEEINERMSSLPERRRDRQTSNRTGSEP